MDTPTGYEQNADQIAYWNGPGGSAGGPAGCARHPAAAGFDILIDAKPAAGERAIDVGCGSGATSIAFAQKVALAGCVFGIDVSGPGAGAGATEWCLRTCRSISRWRTRPSIHRIPQAMIFSPRFGVSFLSIRCPSRIWWKAIKPTGRLANGWREPRENPSLHGAAAGSLQTSFRSCRRKGRRIRDRSRVSLPPRSASAVSRARQVSTAIEMEAANLALSDVAIGRGLEAAVQAHSK